VRSLFGPLSGLGNFNGYELNFLRPGLSYIVSGLLWVSGRSLSLRRSPAQGFPALAVVGTGRFG